MRLKAEVRKTSVLAFALVLLSVSVSHAHHSKSMFEYRYKVHNKSENTITKLLASEDGKKFGAFDIGEGIEPGETATLVWDESTDDGNCEQWIKAVFDDGESSPAKKFDFCEENLVLEFN